MLGIFTAFTRKNKEPIVLHGSCEHCESTSAWMLELSKARMTAGSIPQYANKVNEDGYTLQEVITANHLVAYGNSIGVFMSTGQVADLLVNCTNDSVVVAELDKITKEFKKAISLL